MLNPIDDTFAGVTSSILGQHWRFAPCDERLAASLKRRHDLHDLTARILAARGIDCDDAEGFLAPSLKAALPDPSILQDIEAAALRIARAVESGQQIAIFADYDVDGATSAALWLRFLRHLGQEPILYVPDRIGEGYGPNAPALIGLAARGAKLAITVDCGVTAHESLLAAAEAGLDVVVIDHHMAEAELPRAEAVVNPNRQDDTSGLGHLCAAGVCFLAIIATNRALRARGFYRRRPEPDLLQWLDLVALGTVCDVVPLTGLNRVFVCQGLKVMAGRGNTGLAALADVARVTEKLGAYHLGFMLGPRINAGGRIGKADMGARLLACDSALEAATIAAELDLLNAERRRIEADIIAASMLVAEAADPADPVIVVSGEGWHPGVVGIVASRLTEKFKRPTCVVGIDNGIGKASGRSRPGIDLGALVIAARQAGILAKGGGHAMAAGFTVEEGRIDDLRAFFRQAAGPRVVAPDQLMIEGSLAASGASLAVAQAIETLGPFGQGHREPMLSLLGCRIAKASVVGETHVSCIVTGDHGGAGIKAIAFRAVESALGEALLKSQGRPLHLAGRLGVDRWQGRELAKFEIADAAWAV
jgi:single-stranded-DNA-specific exonuclease